MAKPEGLKACFERPARGGMLAVSLALASSPAGAQDISGKSLGGYPLCEASAALAVDCPGSEGEACILVADNEVDDRLFLFSVDGATGRLSARQDIPIDIKKKNRVSDIKALALSGSGDIHVYGSHSRNSRCKLRPKRQRVLSGRLDDGGFDARLIASTGSKGKVACKTLFDVKRGKAAGNMKALCDALHTAEKAADKAAKLDRKDAAKACNDIEDFNLEGAVAVVGGGQDDIWVGLRAPTSGDGDAFLLRRKGGKAFEFDAVVRLDLNGAGIRELAADKSRIWIISGPANDGAESHLLWRFPKKHLASKKVDAGDLRIRPERLRVALPTSAEGLVVTGGKAYVLIDGAEPTGSSAACNQDSLYSVYSLKEF